MSFLNTKCNAIGLAPEASLALPERAATADEQAAIDALSALYAGAGDVAGVIAPEAKYTAPDGSVHVGATSVSAKLAHARTASAARVLDVSLPAGTIALDLTTAGGARVLVVIKRKTDGRVVSIIEEEGHCRPPRAALGIHSPTDNMLSPCTSKLNLSKRRHHMKAKPTALFAGMSGAQ